MLKRILTWFEQRINMFEPFNERETPPTTVWGFIWYYIKPFRHLLAVTGGVTLLIGIVEASMILLVGRFIDMLAHSSPDALIAQYGFVLALMGGFILFARPLLLILGEVIINQMMFLPIIGRIRWRTHLYTLGHALSYFQSDYAGRLANRIVQSGPAVQSVAIEILDNMAYVVIYAITALIAFSAINWVMGVPVVLWMAAYVLLLKYFVPRAVKLSHIQSEARSVMVGRIVDTYTNIQTVKLFARTDSERSNVQNAIADHINKGFTVMKLLTGTMMTLTMMNMSLLFVTGYIAISLWQRQMITIGEIAAGLALVMRMNDMSRWVMQVVRGIFENLGTVQESMETIAKPHALIDNDNAKTLTVKNGEITFDDVTFNYGKGGGIINHLSFSIKPGEKVGLVGPSGAGKSTIVSLLLRLYDLEGGKILIDGQDIAHVTQDSLRAQIGVVTQDNALLHRSIGNNIAYGRTQATQEEIELAARQAKAHDFIANLADKDGRKGYDSRVGERGVKLSGGQRQRISIARVLLKDAPILVLDEATSALDSQVESAIQEQLTELMQGKTVIAIAHRLSTIAALDRLIVMDQGQIVETGTHAELVAKGGLYADLWSHQSGGFLGHEKGAAA